MGSEPTVAIYPGTFDPLTSGHVSLIRRACEIFDQVVVAVANDTPKSPLFTIEERVNMAAEVFTGNPQVRVEPFSGLLVDYVDRKGARVIAGEAQGAFKASAGCRTFFPHNPGQLAGNVEAYFRRRQGAPFAGEGQALRNALHGRRGNNDDVVVNEGGKGQGGVSGTLNADDTRHKFAFLHLAHDRAGGTDDQVGLGFWVVAQEAGEHSGQYPVGGYGAAADGDDAAYFAEQIADGGFCCFQTGECLFDVPVEDHPCGCGENGAAHTVEKPHMQFVLKGLDMRAYRWLGDK